MDDNRTRYTLGAAAVMLGIDAKTLRDWMDKLGIAPVVDKYDGRRRFISAEDLATLAEAHERVPRPQMTLPEALRRIRALEAEIAALKSAQKRPYAPVTLSEGQEGGSRVRDDESISPAPIKRPAAQHKGPIVRPGEGEVKRNADGEYHYGDDGLTRDEHGLLTDRAFARIAAEHGAKFETARQSWARSIPDSMRGSRTLAVQWMLTNRRSYLTAQCGVADCPCHESEA